MSLKNTHLLCNLTTSVLFSSQNQHKNNPSDSHKTHFDGKKGKVEKIVKCYHNLTSSSLKRSAYKAKEKHLILSLCLRIVACDMCYPAPYHSLSEVEKHLRHLFSLSFSRDLSKKFLRGNNFSYW